MVADSTHNPELWTMPNVPEDSFDFTRVFDDKASQIIERVYPANDFEMDPKLPMIVLLIGGSNVGKDIAMKPLLDKGVLTHVVTGTSREMRTKGPRAEKGHEYVWFDRPTDEEGRQIEELEKLPHDQRTEDKLPDYIKRMIAKFELVEWDVHHGNLYGLPKRSLEEALTRSGVPVIRAESNGAITLRKNLKGIYNVLIVGVLPDSYEQIWQRLKEDTELPYHLGVKRFNDSINITNLLPQLVHFYLHNSADPAGDNVEGKQATARSFEKLINALLIAQSGRKIVLPA
jgi:guanylate kinase